MKVSLNIEDEFSKDDEFRVSEPKPSPSNKRPLHLEFQTPSIPSEGIFIINNNFKYFCFVSHDA